MTLMDLPLNFFFMSPWSPALANMAALCDAEGDEISEEIELLKAIYVHELEILGPGERPTSVNLFLHPSTGDDDHDSKYVCLNLVLTISEKYPFLSPGISIKNPRGLSDAHVVSIQENLLALAKEKIGSPMLYDLIEYAKECLSDNNIPSCPCVICLEHFEKEEKFVKTECYHYFHASCLANYVDHFLKLNAEDKTIVCPMCRLEIEYNKNENEAEQDNSFSAEIFVYKPDEKQLRAQAERQRIFEYQRRKGGIIDIEEERNKFLIGIKDKKEDESKSNEPQPRGIPLETVDSLGLSRGRQGPSLDDGQACTEKGERSSTKNKPQSRNNLKNSKENNWKKSATESQGEDEASWKRTGDKGTGERNDCRPKRSQENRRGGRGQVKEETRERSSFEQAEMPRKEKILNSFTKDEKILKQPRKSKDHVVASQNGTKGERNSKDCNLSNSDCQLNEMFSEKLEESRRPLDAMDGGKIEKSPAGLKLSTAPSKTNQLKLSSSSFSKSTQSRNMEARKERYRSSHTKNISDNPTSKQVTNKQAERKPHERNEAQRKSKSERTPGRPREESKDGRKYSKSYSSVTSGTNRIEIDKRKDQSIKRKNALISENNNKSENSSGRNFPGQSEKNSPDVAENVVKSDAVNKHSGRTAPPPGFDNFRPDVVKHLVERELRNEMRKTLPTTHEEPRDGSQRPPPGFENVKSSVKKL